MLGFKSICRPSTFRSTQPLLRNRSAAVFPSTSSRFVKRCPFSNDSKMAMEKSLIYEGPFWKILSLLKKVSVFSCVSTMIGVPLLSFFGTDNLKLAQRLSVGFTVCAFAIGTTSTLHFVCKPYVCKIFKHASSDALDFVTLTIIGRTKTTTVPSIKELSTSGSDRLFSSFKNTEGRFFYVHEESVYWKDGKVYREIMELLESGEQANV